MTKQVGYKIDTPCGFEIWVILHDNGTISQKAYFGHEEVGMDFLNGKLTREGALMLAEKIKEIL